MNRRLVFRILGTILLIEALAMAPSLLIALVYGDGDALALGITIGALCAIGLPLWVLIKPIKPNLRAREGFVVVALSWVLLSAFGALPFVISGAIPNYVDAFFEAVSGFTTTGATIMTNFDNQFRGIMFWRSFTHWIGGMGVLVLTLALLPQMTGRTAHLVRAESPGPSLSKIVPKMGDSAKILYMMYGALTAIQFAILVIVGTSPYDSAIYTMGTAGTGGFGIHALSVGVYQSPVIDVIITVFMVLFGINFALFYRVLTGAWRDAVKNDELHWYLGLFGVASIIICVLIMPIYGSVGQSLRYSTFQVASLMSTTGYATADFNLWPQAAKMILVLLMFVGSCAGSTAGGLKVVRLALLCKITGREVRHTFQPRKVQVVRFEGKGVEEPLLTQVAVFFFVYILLILLGALAISFEGLFDFETNFTAALTCVSNVGPGFSMVGPMENFAGYGPMAKIILSVLMLAGRLEIFPILVLFHPAVWKKQ